MLAVSYCNRDLYGGAGYLDPNNPNRLPEGSRRTTNGLLSTRAAVRFVQGRYPTEEVFLHGTSAGSVGALGAAWRFQRHGIDVAGVVADASVVNREMAEAARAQQLCGEEPDRSAEIGARVHPDLADIDNEGDKLVTCGQLRAPVLHTWVRGDGCGEVSMTCPLRNGSTVMMGAFDCSHEPLRAAIEAGGPASRSTNLRRCVDDPNRPAACDQHVVTTRDGMTNTDPSSRPNYLWTIMEWVRARLADA